MKNQQKGSMAVVLLVIVVIVLAVVIGWMYFKQPGQANQVSDNSATQNNTDQSQQNLNQQQSVTASEVPVNQATNLNSPASPSMSGYKTYSDSQLGLSFQYPSSLNSNFAHLNSASALVASSKNLDSNGCYVSPVFVGTERAGMSDSKLTINNISFCASNYGDPGAGQLNTSYYYTFYRNGNYITLDYEVQTPNGCGAYEGTSNYQSCQDAGTSANTIIQQPIQTSVASLKFTN
jgi:hypothetical protein